jgi:hypothetical protein
LAVVEDIDFLDRVLLNDEIVVVNQQRNFLVVEDERLKLMELIMEQEEEVVVEVERQVVIGIEMDDEIDDD